MREAFIDSAERGGQQRIREYVLGWLERLDYGGKLERAWPPAELARVVWDKVERDFTAHWRGPVVSNRELARVVALVVVEDYFECYPHRRGSRYSVRGPLTDAAFRRCVLDYVHDVEEFSPSELSDDPAEVVAVFWAEVRENPHRWGCSPEKGPFVDDEATAHRVALEVVGEYYTLRSRVAAQRAEADA